MTFSTQEPEQKTNFSSNTSNLTPPKEPWKVRFISQPHQLFFATSIVFAILTMIGAFASMVGISYFDFSTVHSFGLMFGVFTNAFIGFLITVIPKYTSSQTLEKSSYIKIWLFYQIGILIGLLVWLIIGKVIVFLTLGYLVKIFLFTIKDGKAIDKKESYLLIGILSFGAFLLFCEAILFINLSYLLFWGYLVSLVFVVALKMVPAFYSIFANTKPWEKGKYIYEIAIILFLLIGISTQFELVLIKQIVAVIAFCFFGYIMIKLNIYKKSPSIISILVVAFVWFYFGICAFLIESFLEIYTLKLSLHIISLGFILNLLIGFGSRVVMGHANPPQKIVADKFTISLFILIQIIIILRIMGSILYIKDVVFFEGFLHLSIFLWIVLFVFWGIRYGKTIFVLK